MNRRSPFSVTLLTAATSLSLVLGLSPAGALAIGGSDDPVEIALSHLDGARLALRLSAADLADLEVTDRYVSQHTGVTHVYLRQQVRGIAVLDGTVGVHVARDGSVIQVGDHLVRGLERRTQPSRVRLTAEQAVARAAAELELAAPSKLVLLEQSSGPRRESRLSDGGISLREIPARLVYQLTPDGELRLAWSVEIYQLDATHYWHARIDAADGSLLAVDDFVDEDEYRVYPIPIESPNHTTPLPPADARTLEIDPATAASPFAWHDTDGAAGAEFTITRGNNAHAYEDTNNSNSGTSPDCGAGLSCDFPIDLTQQPIAYQDASIANLFYWNNVIHDVMYDYGFDEPAGNFQENNYGNGGLGSDYVRAEGQDGGGNCNANFFTPADGSLPRMQMYLCSNTNPSRDGSLDNNVITHEYGHGISNRLTGGPSNVGCLNNSEQMGEGWSDWLAVTFTQQTNDGVTPRGMGTYLFGQPPDGPGIRPAPYTTDMSINPFTYGDIGSQSIPHGVGFVWATMLWDMSWALVDEHGFNVDLYDDWTTGGNNLALQLVTDGMKLQTCSPGFVDGRDAILAADDQLTGDGSPGSGANQCIIWEAFAARGLGASADQGSSGSTSDGTEAFDLPQSCLGLVALDEVANICAGVDAQFTLEVNSPFVPPVTMSVVGEPVGTTAMFSPNPLNGPLPQNTVLTIGNTGGVPDGSYPLTATADDTSQMLDVGLDLNVFDLTPGTPTLTLPADGAIDVALAPTYEWSSVAQAYEYLLEVDDDPGFGSIDYSATVTGANTHTPSTPLEPVTTYFWRVTSSNPCGTGGTSAVFSFTTRAIPPVLLVDDDDNSADVRSFFTDALDALGVAYDIWDTANSDNEPGVGVAVQYQTIIWFTGDEFGGFAGPGPAGEAALATYLDGGGCLLLSSQDYHFDRGLTPFMETYLGVQSVTDDNGNYSAVTGATGSIFDGLGPYPLNYAAAGLSDFSDTVTASVGGQLALDGDNGNDAAVQRDGGAYKTVFLGFPWPAIEFAADREESLQAFLDFCPSLNTDIFSDGFESGDTSAWSLTVP